MDKENLGKLIRQKRKEKKMTQGELAERLHVDVSTVSKWEVGKNAVSPQCHKAISEVLGIPLSVLQGNSKYGASGKPPSNDEAIGGSMVNPEGEEKGDLPLEAETVGNSPSVIEMAGSSSPETKSGDDPSKEDGDSQNDLPENYPQQKQQAKGKKKFLFQGAGVILLAAAALVFFIWRSNQHSYIVHSEYFEVFQEQDACYLVAEYKGKFNRDILNEYVKDIRIAYENYFEKVDIIIILFLRIMMRNRF